MALSAHPILCLALLVIAVMLACCQTAVAEDGFKYGRGTFYDDNGQTCVEVACVDKDFSDGYGEKVNRSGVCHDSKKSVVVKITEACPCEHSNQYSNKRSCCGDMRHLDLGRKAFQELPPAGV
ncbi:hypothetical protein COO60DRAFT_1457214 [Scenedesmus sp. NREL 46B-D3]|nr:hypothetical protein COO60DRAFT_1457214 [Scenedesmus sp. NREL 46B-D3]